IGLAAASVAAGAATGDGVDAFSTAARLLLTSSALGGRFPGSFSRIWRIKASSRGGQPGLCHVGATGAVVRCCEMTATVSSPTNGGRPVTISYNTQPRA